jgi:ribonuclease BN (tRNA processing enzyme)
MVLEPEQLQSVAGTEVYSFRVPHQSDDVSLGLKVTYQGRQILFSGDSAWTDSFIEHARGVDLFLCECSYYDDQPNMHVNYRALTANLSRLKCKQLVLTHLGEDMLARRHLVSEHVAEDGMVIEI